MEEFEGGNVIPLSEQEQNNEVYEKLQVELLAETDPEKKELLQIKLDELEKQISFKEIL